MGKIKNRVVSVILLMLITITMISISGCGKNKNNLFESKLSESEAIEKVSTLVVDSYDINVVVYGAGLPTLDLEEEEESLYRTVIENDKFNSTIDIRKEIERLYSKRFASIMINTALVGTPGEYGQTIIYARYIDGKYGLSMIKDNSVIKGDDENEDDASGGIDVLKYDPSTIRIHKISARFIEAYITSESGETTILVTLILEDGEWKIDCPTY